MWTAFAASAGGSAAGLTGLTFIVTAFRFDVIAVSQEYRNRAAQVLVLFLTIVVTAALVTVPQPRPVLGVELVTAATVSTVLLLVLDAAARRGSGARLHLGLTMSLTAFVTGLAVGGVLLIADTGAGMYSYAIGAVIGLGWGAYGAWVFLTTAGISPADTA